MDSSNIIEKAEEHISQNWFTSKTDKQTLQERGHRWKQGQWTAEENEILKQNIRFYCQVCNKFVKLGAIGLHLGFTGEPPDQGRVTPNPGKLDHTIYVIGMKLAEYKLV